MGEGCTASNQGNKPSDLGLGATSVLRLHSPFFPPTPRGVDGESQRGASDLSAVGVGGSTSPDTHSMTSLADVARLEGEREERFCWNGIS